MTLPTISTMPSQAALSVMIVDDESPARARLSDLLSDVAAEVPNAVVAEAANGELGFHFVSDGSGRPYKCKVRPPCFYMMGGFHEMVEGSMIADAIANLGSINIIGGELDR